MKYFLLGKGLYTHRPVLLRPVPRAFSTTKLIAAMLVAGILDAQASAKTEFSTAHLTNYSAPLTAFAMQDQITVTGTIRDESGTPLNEATVSVKGRTSFITKTNSEGYFSLRVPTGSTIRVTYLGYQPQEIATTGAGPYNFTLQTESSELDEVVVVGYGTQSKKEFTGAAARISGEALRDIPVQSFDQALTGRASGVNISQPNGVLNNAPVIRIRGVNSISLSSYPLFVIDGIPVTSGDVSSNATVPNNPLADINPSDIESIDVLKDAASTAIYGSRGANGVILVTTKRGKEGGAKLTYDGWVGFSSPVRLPELLDAEQFMTIKNEAQLNRKILSGQADNPNVASALFFPSYNADGSLVNTNWYDYIFQTGVSHNHSASISGGNAKTKYFFSANLSEQQGILQTNEFDRAGMRFSVDHEATPWLKLNTSINYTNSENRSPNSGSRDGNAQLIVGAARMAWTLNPNVPVYEADGVTPHLNNNVNGNIGNGANQVVSVYYHPLTLFELAKYTSANDRVLANVGATVTFLEGLTFTTNYALDRMRTTNINSISALPGSSAAASNGSVTNVSALYNNWNFTNTLNYDVRFGGHHFAAMAGMDVQVFENDRWGANRTQASDPYFVDYQGSFGQITHSGNLLNKRALLSYLGRLSYDYNLRYIVTASFRRDGNSALGMERKWGSFGGASFGWTVSEEQFFKDWDIENILSSVRFRASWGRVGNGDVDPYASLDLYSSSLYGAEATWNISQAGNANLGWETGEQTNIGADIALFNNRLQFDFSWFNNDVNGLILNVPQAPSKGIPGNAIYANVGSLYNRGIELSISGDVIRKDKFTWNSSFNFTSTKNEVTSLATEGSRMVPTSSGNPFNMIEAGYSVGYLYGAITNGINPANGQRIYVNAKGEQVQYSAASTGSQWTYLDGSPASQITADDYQPLGNALPTWYGGFNNTLRYAGFDLGINFSYSGGNYLLNGNTGTWLDQRYFNNSVKVLDRWQQPGDITDVPRLVFNDNFASANIPNISAYVEKADFLRLQNVLLGYRVPTQLLGRSGVTSLRIYAQASNVFLFTNYSGLDPESSINGNRNTSPGIEYNSLGNGRTITFGVNVGF